MPAFEGLFRKFPNRVFIETGTFMGSGVESAVWAGFPLVISIEFAECYYEYSKDKFKYFPNVQLICGDSGVVLEDVLSLFDYPATIWLDAHYSEQNTAKGPSPLFKELKAINEHRIKTHSILIDDIADYNIEEVKKTLSNYKTFQQFEDILICLP